MKRIISILFVFTTIASISFSAEKKYGLQKGDYFPVITFVGENKNIKSTDLEGKITIISLGAVWCPACKEERPLLNDFYKSNKENVNVIGVLGDSSKNEFLEFFKKNKVDFPVYYDKDNEILDKLFIQAFPSSYVLDKDGKIMARVVGGVEWDKIKLSEIQKLQIR